LLISIFSPYFVGEYMQERIRFIMSEGIFSRAEGLLGAEAMERMRNARVIIFGVGGVGSWCAESLVRTGVHRLTIVDNDVVCASNVNRQMMATTKTIGQVKVEALKERLLEINPGAEIIALHKVYTESTADEFALEEYDYIVDAIDSIADKMLLILRACETDAVFFSSMGAARKLDSSRIGVSEFWKVKGCPLGASLRRKFRAQGTFPKRKFQCVYSDEQPQGDICLGLGSMHHITSVFGITIAGLVVRDICLRE
jgi:tRNA A37 threonylcarbamoyladenosine dehydratase